MQTEYKKNGTVFVKGMFGYALAFLLFVYFTQEGYSITSRLIGWALFVVGTFPFLMYLSKRASHVPVIEFTMLAYVNSFSLPMFFQKRQVLLVKTLYPENEPVAYCLMLALLSVCSLWIGYQLAPKLLRSLKLPKINLRCNNQKLFLYGCFMCLFSFVKNILPLGSFQGLMNVVISPDLGVALLSFLYWQNLLNRKKNIIVIIIVFILVVNGMAIGMTQHILQPLMIFFLCRWFLIRTTGVKYVALAVVLFVLIQPVKLNYRGIVWTESSKFDFSQKVSLFSNLFYQHWITSEIDSKIDESTYERTSLLLQTAHVIDWTPSVVPYKNGETLYFILVDWIPRFLWPGKPTAQQANKYYALDYGVTTVKGAQSTMFGVGHLAELFMNFGEVGVMPGFFLIGVMSFIPLYLLSINDSYLSNIRSISGNVNIATMSIVTVILIRFIFITTSIAGVFGGVFQLIVFQTSLLYLVAGVRQKQCHEDMLDQQ